VRSNGFTAGYDEHSAQLTDRLEKAVPFSVCFEVLTAGKHQCNSLIILKEFRNNSGG